MSVLELVLSFLLVLSIVVHFHQANTIKAQAEKIRVLSRSPIDIIAPIALAVFLCITAAARLLKKE